MFIIFRRFGYILMKTTYFWDNKKPFIFIRVIRNKKNKTTYQIEKI